MRVFFSNEVQPRLFFFKHVAVFCGAAFETSSCSIKGYRLASINECDILEEVLCLGMDMHHYHFLKFTVLKIRLNELRELFCSS